MGEAKPFASLSSTLLARKGQAKPAMRPQGFASFGFGAPHPGDDLGWNDMGHTDYPAQGGEVVTLVLPEQPTAPLDLTPEPPVVLQQQEALKRELTVALPTTPEPVLEPELAPTPASRAAPGSKRKAAFTLRLDPDRHLRLRLACAVTHRSAQALVVEALDAFLDKQPAVDTLARTAATHDDQSGANQ